jgi:tRNA (guanine26-N2/guanine27-N2)-dimethyltransferase
MLAAKHDIEVSPVFSYSDYNYVRTYATASYGAKRADNSVQKMGYIMHCFSCFHRESQLGLTPVLRRDCPKCGSRLQVAGPLWLGSLWDQEFCRMLDSEAMRKSVHSKIKILKLLSLITKEMHAPITYYAIDKLCDKFNLPVPSLSRVMKRLSAKGFQAGATHFSSKAVRTDAPATVLKDSLVDLAKVSGS